MSTPQDTSPWRIVLLLVIMLAILVGVQFLPLSEWTGGRLSNVNLLSSVSDHVFHEDVIMDTAPVDPLLAELEAEDAESPAAVRFWPNLKRKTPNLPLRSSLQTLR